ncbi:hypothetical protein [Candidatus Liberibacter sp.]|uniref:hypothetical protein n=1 Tax=Candidatus Liberibacter sp. TaxID=34022 RepID=UPI0015F48CFE|nr:hypothetical protein [Candidatus Liberibacter sp.]MBA5724068.1 hypothetical protein [Candidatus Liberibacter sp.]
MEKRRPDITTQDIIQYKRTKPVPYELPTIEELDESFWRRKQPSAEQKEHLMRIFTEDLHSSLLRREDVPTESEKNSLNADSSKK